VKNGKLKDQHSNDKALLARYLRAKTDEERRAARLDLIKTAYPAVRRFIAKAMATCPFISDECAKYLIQSAFRKAFHQLPFEPGLEVFSNFVLDYLAKELEEYLERIARQPIAINDETVIEDSKHARPDEVLQQEVQAQIIRKALQGFLARCGVSVLGRTIYVLHDRVAHNLPWVEIKRLSAEKAVQLYNLDRDEVATLPRVQALSEYQFQRIYTDVKRRTLEGAFKLVTELKAEQTGRCQIQVVEELFAEPVERFVVLLRVIDGKEFSEITEVTRRQFPEFASETFERNLKRLFYGCIVRALRDPEFRNIKVNQIIEKIIAMIGS